jgi:mannosyl-3-phosphoglycerate phosphatase
MPYEFLVKCLMEIREELGWQIRGFSEMNPDEISHLTGLDLKSSRLAAIREYDEHFIVEEPEDMDLDSLQNAAKKRGLKITKGGRFYHLHGKNDKGAAVEKVISWYRDSHHQVFTIALGNSPNDVSMLKQVDCPVLIRSSPPFPGIGELIPALRVTPEVGPKGWNSVVLDILGERM